MEGESAEEIFFLVGSSLGDEENEELVRFLRANIDVFACQPYDMPEINAKIMCYRLHIDKDFKPVKQKPKRAAPKKVKAVGGPIPRMDIQPSRGKEEKREVESVY